VRRRRRGVFAVNACATRPCNRSDSRDHIDVDVHNLDVDDNHDHRVADHNFADLHGNDASPDG
jgi:hypothetical protein